MIVVPDRIRSSSARHLRDSSNHARVSLAFEQRRLFCGNRIGEDASVRRTCEKSVFLRCKQGVDRFLGSSKNARGLITDARIEDVESAREGERDDVAVAAPGISGLLVVDALPKVPGRNCLLCFYVP